MSPCFYQGFIMNSFEDEPEPEDENWDVVDWVSEETVESFELTDYVDPDWEEVPEVDWVDILAAEARKNQELDSRGNRFSVIDDYDMYPVKLDKWYAILKIIPEFCYR